MADDKLAAARREAEEALARVLANAAAIIRLSWSDGATAADCANLERIKSAAADIAQDHKILRALLAAGPETKACGQDRIAELESLLRECNAVCLCGCTDSEHEADECGESCGHEDHECIRVPRAVLAYVERLRSTPPPAGAEVREAAERVVWLEERLSVASRSLLGSPAHTGLWDAIKAFCSERNLIAREEAVVRVEVAVRMYAARLLSALRATASPAPGSEGVREAAERLRRARESNFLTCTDSRVRAEGNRVLLLEVDALLATLATVTVPTLTERKEKDYEDARCEAHSLLRSLAPELAPHKSLAVEITQISDAVAGLLAARGGE